MLYVHTHVVCESRVAHTTAGMARPGVPASKAAKICIHMAWRIRPLFFMLLTACFSFARTGRAGRGRVVPLSVPPGDRNLFLSSFVELKSLFGGRRRLNPGQLGYSQYPSGPGMKSATAHSDPACVPPIPWLPSRGTQIERHRWMYARGGK